MRKLLLLALAVLLLAGCRHTPPVVVPTPTPSPTVAPAATPTPEPTPDWGAFGPRRYFFWGADGARAEQATQVSVWRQEVRPLCVVLRMGANGLLEPHREECSPMHGDQEARLGMGESWAQVKARMRQWFEARVKDGDMVWVGINWIGLVLGPDGEVVSTDLVPDIIDVYAEYWDHVAAIWLDGEAGLTGKQLDSKARYVQGLLRRRGLAFKPMTYDALESELWSMRPQDAKNPWLVWLLEAYDAGKGSGNRAEDRRLIHDALARQLALLPAGSRFGVWLAAYDRNGAWEQSREDLAAVPTHAVEWVMADPARRRNCAVIAVFCWVRAGNCNGGYCGGGARDYPLIAQQIKRGIAWLETGSDPGPAVPPAEVPTPTPTPQPNAPGVIAWDSNACSVSGAVATCTAKRVGVGPQAPAAAATVAVRTVCGDCGADAEATLSFPAGRQSKDSFTVDLSGGGSQLCQRTSEMVGSTGAPIEPSEGYAWASWAPSDKGVRWFKCSGFYASAGNGVGTVVISRTQADAARPWSVTYHMVSGVGAASKPKVKAAARDEKGAVPSTLALLEPVISPPGQLCLDRAEYTDTHTPVPIVAQACVPFGAR